MLNEASSDPDQVLDGLSKLLVDAAEHQDLLGCLLPYSGHLVVETSSFQESR